MLQCVDSIMVFFFLSFISFFLFIVVVSASLLLVEPDGVLKVLEAVAAAVDLHQVVLPAALLVLPLALLGRGNRLPLAGVDGVGSDAEAYSDEGR